MLAAQLIAAHYAAMECYRRGMIDEQTLEGRRDQRDTAARIPTMTMITRTKTRAVP